MEYVLCALRRRTALDHDTEIDKMGVAIKYTYPMKYVEEILWGKIEAARRRVARV